mmetsp:Transcript_25261/g.72033  ORF Transcript_25261/g.72033 Transcript_25261/m.72033 type:complete len:222 (+) Transcript_25261:83-748(+)
MRIRVLRQVSFLAAASAAQFVVPAIASAISLVAVLVEERVAGPRRLEVAVRLAVLAAVVSRAVSVVETIARVTSAVGARNAIGPRLLERRALGHNLGHTRSHPREVRHRAAYTRLERHLTNPCCILRPNMTFCVRAFCWSSCLRRNLALPHSVRCHAHLRLCTRAVDVARASPRCLASKERVNDVFFVKHACIEAAVRCANANEALHPSSGLGARNEVLRH